MNKVREQNKKDSAVSLPVPCFQHTSVNAAAGTFTKSLAVPKFPYLACTEYDLGPFSKTYNLA